MSVVENREMNGNREQFPIGMRVLAVDDDPICLKLLEALLLRCQYHVTTANQAVVALRMLRENRDGFDMVISDVHMPDMDGFKLLELVGLEMDLPVIMLSADGETQAVLKGITHGAVDYLLKPVRIEELKNIWQHVVRRKKFDPKDQNNADSGDDCDKGQLANFEGGQGSTANGSSDRNGKINRKRRELDEEGEDDDEESDPDNEDPSAQKKPRVVWSRDLHKKFVDAVNQLGIDKAVPKRILDLMNVERLTRENVASHLQKYRIFLKKMSVEANLQANMAAAFRGRDPSSYLPMGSFDGYANFNALVGPRPLSSRSSFQPNGALPKINDLTGFGLHGLSGQLGHSLNTSTSINELGKHQGISLATLHGMPTSLELEKLQQPKAIQEASSRLLGGFSGSGVRSGHSNSFASVTKSPLVLQASQNKTAHSGGHTNQSSTGIPSLSSDPFEIGFGDSSHFADPGRCNETWRGATPSTKYPANPLPSSVAISRSDLSSSTIRNNVTPTVSQLGCSGSDVTSSSVVMAPLVDPMIRNDALGVQSNASSLLMRASANGDAKLLHYGSLGNSKLNWLETNQAHVQNSSHIYNSLQNSSLPNIGLNDRSVGNQTLENGFSRKNMDMPINRQTSFGAPFVAQDLKILKTAVGGQFNHKGEPFSEDMKLHSGYGFNSCSLDDLVNSMIKSERDDFFFDGNMACDDNFPLGACM